MTVTRQSDVVRKNYSQFIEKDPKTVGIPPSGETYVGTLGNKIWSKDENGVINYSDSDYVYRGAVGLTDAEPSNLNNGNWVRATESGTMTNFSGVTVVAGDRIEYSADSASWSTYNDSGSGYITLVANLDANDFKVENLANSASEKDGVNQRQLLGKTENYPYLEDNEPTGSSSKMSITQCREFVIDMYLTGSYDAAKVYSIALVKRSSSTNQWLIRISEHNADGSSPVDVARFTAASNPVDGDNITVHDLPEYAGSGISGRIAVRWSAVPNETNYYSMLSNIGYELSVDIWDDNKVPAFMGGQQMIDLDANGFKIDNELTAEAKAIELINAYDEDLSFQGFVDAATSTPSHTANNTYIALATATIFGISVEKGEMIIDDGTDFYARRLKVKTSKILTEDRNIKQIAPYLDAKQIDDIILSLHLEGCDPLVRYAILKIINNYGGAWAIEICEIDASDVITAVAIFTTTTAQSGIKYHEIGQEYASGITGNCVINWDVIPSGVLFDLGTVSRIEGYILKDNVFAPRVNDLSGFVKNYNTVYDAVQDEYKGTISVGKMQLKSNTSTIDSIEDYKSVFPRNQVSEMLDVSYIGCGGAYLLLIDSKKDMWWKYGTSLYRCSMDTFKDSLVSSAHASETRYTFDPANLTLIQAINVFAIREFNGHLIAQSNIAGDNVGDFWYWDGSTFQTATVPNGGRIGELRNAWGFDAWSDYVVTNGYAGASYGNGRVLFSSDGGQTYKEILNIATTGLLTTTERAIAHIHGCTIDRYNGNRIYVYLGDYSQAPPAGKVFYTDNPEDASPAWTKMEIDVTESTAANEQYISGFGMDNGMLFGTDMLTTGVYRMARVNETHVQRELALHMSDNIEYAPGSYSKWSSSDPVIFYNQAIQTTPLLPSQMYVTYDGIDFFKIWEDSVGHEPFYNTRTPIWCIDGEIFADQQEGPTNRRFSPGGTIVWGRIITQ